MIEINREKWILIAGLTLLIFAALTAHASAGGTSTITTDKQEYKCGETVVITYNFVEPSRADVIPRISIYQDPSFVLHIVTWDAQDKTSVQKWDTKGLWDGTYYVVAKYHRPMGLLYEEEIIAITKISITGGAKQQHSLIQTKETFEKDQSLSDRPIVTLTIYQEWVQEVFSWLRVAL